MDQLLKDHDEVGFVIAFLKAKGFADEAQMIARATAHAGHSRNNPDDGTTQTQPPTSQSQE